MNPPGGFDNLLTGRTLADHLQVISGGEQRGKPGTHKFMVIDN
jgi:hypothetical protein